MSITILGSGSIALSPAAVAALGEKAFVTLEYAAERTLLRIRKATRAPGVRQMVNASTAGSSHRTFRLHARSFLRLHGIPYGTPATIYPAFPLDGDAGLWADLSAGVTSDGRGRHEDTLLGAGSAPWLRYLGPAIRITREERQLQQDALAELAGISKSKLSAYETGRAAPRLDVLARIIDALAISPLAFFYVAHLVGEAAGTVLLGTSDLSAVVLAEFQSEVSLALFEPPGRGTRHPPAATVAATRSG